MPSFFCDKSPFGRQKSMGAKAWNRAARLPLQDLEAFHQQAIEQADAGHVEQL
jgi:hypothetical protein